MADEKKVTKFGILERMKEFNIQGKAANINIGGQYGAGYQPDALDTATPLVFMPTTCIVMQTPTMYDKTPAIGKMIKSIIESQAKTISGIDFGYTLETATTIAGNDGQEHEVPVSTKRSAVSPNFTMQEVTGNIIWNMLKTWLWDIHHPDTNRAFSMKNSDEASPYVTSSYSMSMLAIQFDPTQSAENIIDAAFYANMFPKATGEIGFEKTVGTSKVMERSIDFSGIVYHNDYTKILGKQIAATLNLNALNYNNIKTGTSQVEANIKDAGIQLQAAAVAKNQGPADTE